MDSSSARNVKSRNTKQAVRRTVCGWEHRDSPFLPTAVYLHVAWNLPFLSRQQMMAGGRRRSSLGGASTPEAGIQARTCISETAECLFWSGCQFQGPAFLHDLSKVTASRKGVHELLLCQGQDARSHWHSQSQAGSTLCFLGACTHRRWLLPALHKVLWQLALSLKESSSRSLLLPFHLFMGYTSHSVKCQLLSHVCSLPGSSVHGILQAKILGGLPVPSPRDFPNPGTKLRSPALQADSLLSEPPGKPIYLIVSDMILFMLFW